MASTGNKKKNTGRTTKSSERVKTQSEPKKAARNEKKNSARVRDIILLVVIAVALLVAVSVYSPAIPWLKTACYFLFGFVMYASPVLLVLLFLGVLFLEKTGSFYRRLFASILFLFALSGIFSFAFEVGDGGLLGLANYTMFESWLGSVGAYIVNGLLMAISLVLFIDFSLFGYLHRQGVKAQERRKEIKALRAQEALEREEEERETRLRSDRALEEERVRKQSLKDYQEKLDQKAEQNRERFTPRYGIGNTLITDDDPALGTTFYQGEPFEQNAAMFGSYKNSGREAAEEKDEGTSFIPNISFADQDDQNQAAPPVSDDPDEEYTKVIVTGQGRVLRTPSTHADFKSSLALKNTAADSKDDVLPVIPDKPAPEPKKEYHVPPMTLLTRGSNSNVSKAELRAELAKNKEILENTCQIFNVPISVVNISCGPSVTRYEVQPAQGIRVSRIQGLENDIKLALAASDIRIEAPIPGKSAVGIEVPNKAKSPVVLRTLIESEEFKKAKSSLAFGLGMDIDGHMIISDLQKMPHLLVAGTTGSGKSVCLNTMIMSILYHVKPTDVKMILIDPKVIEFSGYKGIPHLLMPVVTDPKKASMALSWAVNEMEKRYEKFAKYGVRNIEGYNQYIELEQPEDEMGQVVKTMPLILIIVDEFADMMMVAAKDVENSVIRLAQKARAAGIHLVLATQSPRADVITGIIKANIPSRIALSVSSSLESRIILDMNGAEALLGHGDMLYAPAGASKPIRIQGAFVSDNEIKSVVEYISAEGNVKGSGTNGVDLDSDSSTSGGSGGSDRDEFFAEAGRIIIDKQKASIGMLQRVLSIGFNRAARIMDQLCDAGVVGEEEGTKPRRILMTMAQFEDMLKE